MSLEAAFHKIVIVRQPKQKLFWNLVENSPATWLGIGGSRGGTKSWTGRHVIFHRRITHPGTKGVILRRTYELVRENHIDPLLSEYPFLREYYYTGDKEIRLPNGSVIAFRSGETRGDIEAMIGKQYMDGLVDQAEMFTERELSTIKSCIRWPGVSDTQCKMLLTFNPGNVGHSFLKRIFYDKQYTDKERAQDYAFVPAHGWDNVEWCRSSLERDGFTVHQYYHEWNEDQRFEYFIKESQYGRELNALPPALRLGWLMGSMDQFAGQYFDIFSMERHVQPVFPEPWHSRWIGIDWGFGHEAAAQWSAQIEAKKVGTYREFVAAGRSPKALAQEIVDRTPAEEHKQIKMIWLSHDAFAKKDEREPINIQMGEVFRANGWPWPQNAGADPIGRAALLYDMFREDRIVIDPRCVRLIETIPMVTRDPDHPEKTVKFDGDDAYDAFTHSLMSHMTLRPMPDDVRLREEAKKIKDPFSKWFFVTEGLRKIRKPIIIKPNRVMPWEVR